MIIIIITIIMFMTKVMLALTLIILTQNTQILMLQKSYNRYIPSASCISWGLFRLSTLELVNECIQEIFQDMHGRVRGDLILPSFFKYNLVVYYVMWPNFIFSLWYICCTRIISKKPITISTISLCLSTILSMCSVWEIKQQFCKYVEAKTQWPPLSRRHFQAHFLERKL